MRTDWTYPGAETKPKAGDVIWTIESDTEGKVHAIMGDFSVKTLDAEDVE